MQHSYQDALLKPYAACAESKSSQSQDEPGNIMNEWLADRLQKIKSLEKKLCSLHVELEVDEKEEQLMSNKYFSTINALMLKERIKRLPYIDSDLPILDWILHEKAKEAGGHVAEQIFMLKKLQAQTCDGLRVFLRVILSHMPFYEAEIDAAVVKLDKTFEPTRNAMIWAVNHRQEPARAQSNTSRQV
jgi:hypothetical protein